MTSTILSIPKDIYQKTPYTFESKTAEQRVLLEDIYQIMLFMLKKCL